MFYRNNQTNLARVIQANNVTGDTTKPAMSYFNLNMTSLELTIFLSETVESTVNVSSIMLKNSVNTSDADFRTVALSSSSTIAVDLNVVVITMSMTDGDNIKNTAGLCTSAADTFLSMQAATVYDKAGFPNDAVTQTVNAYAQDTVSPEIVAFDVLMNASAPPAHVVIVFTEAVAIATVNTSGFVLQDAPSSPNVTLSLDEVTVERGDGPEELVLVLSPTLLQQLRAFDGIAKYPNATYLSVQATAVTDDTSNPVLALSEDNALGVRLHTIDVVRPRLQEFSLDLNSSLLALVFSEAVLVETMAINAVMLQAVRTTTNASHTLTSTSAIHGESLAKVVVQLNAVDIVALQSSAVLAVNTNTTFLSLQPNAVSDSAGNLAEGIDAKNALGARNVQASTVGPRAVSFALNMTSGVLHVQFDKVVDVRSVNMHAFQIMGSNSTTPVVLSEGLDGVVTSTNSTLLAVTLSMSSANALRANPRIAVSVGTTNLVVASSAAVRDVDGNAVRDTGSEHALTAAAGVFVPDMEPPQMVAFNLDLTSGTLQLLYSQPVNSSSLIPEAFQLQNKLSAPEYTHILTGSGATIADGISTTVEVDLAEDDLNAIKSAKLCGATSNGTDCYLSFGNFSVLDATGLVVTGIEPQHAIPIQTYEKDTIAPVLVSDRDLAVPRFDLNTHELTLQFSEVVDSASMIPTKLTLVSEEISIVSPFVSSHQVQNASVMSHTGTRMVIRLSIHDAIILQSIGTLATKRTDLYLDVEQGFLSDLAGNALVPTGFFNLEVFEFVQDHTPPMVMSFALDANAHTFTIVTSEVLDLDSIKRSRFAVQIASAGGASVTLDSCEENSPCISSAQYGTVFVIAITTPNMNAMKLNGIGSDANRTFLTIAPFAAYDTEIYTANALIVIPPSAALPVADAGFYQDTQGPVLVGFKVAMEDGTLDLYFDEPVQPLLTNVTGITLRGGRNSTRASIVVSNSAVVVNAAVNVSQTVIVRLSPAVVVILKKDNAMFTSVHDTFIAVAPGMFVDAVGNANQGIPDSAAVQAVEHVDDIVAGKVQNFTINIAARTVELYFSDVIAVSSFVADKIGFQNVSNAASGVEYYLQQSTLLGPDAHLVTLALSHEDYLVLGNDPLIATSRGNTFLSMGAAALNDYANRDVITITTDNALQAYAFIPDVTKPTLTEAAVNMTDATIVLTLSEAIALESFEVNRHVTLQNRRNASSSGPAVVKYELHNSTATLSDDQLVVTISLGEIDYNYLLLNTHIATSAGTTFFTHTASAFADLSGNAPETIPEDAAFSVAEALFFPDIRLPELVGFDLNMNTGRLVVRFTEPINVSTVQVDQFIFQDRQEASETFQLRAGSVLTDINDQEIEIILTVADQNIIKQKSVAITEFGTFLRLQQGAVVDMSGNMIAAIASEDAIAVSDFSADNQPPVLLSFDLNLSSAELTLQFQETIEFSSVNVTGIRIHSTVQRTSSVYEEVVLSTTSTVVNQSEDTVAIRLSQYDVDAIAVRAHLGVDVSTTYLSMAANVAQDMNGNGNLAVVAQGNGSFTPDLVPPRLTTVALNMDTLQMNLTFTEVMHSQTLNVSGISVATASDSNATRYTLTTAAAYLVALNSSTVRFTLSAVDAIALKYRQALAINAASTIVTLATGSIRDTSGNGARAPATIAILTDDFRADITQPGIESFSLDLNTSHIVLTMSEPVAGVDVSKLALSSTASDINSTGVSITNGSSYVLYDSATVIVVRLSSMEMNQIKAHSDLATLRHNTILVVGDGFCVDRAVPPNRFAGIAASANITAAEVVPDTIAPTVLAITFNADVGVLLLTMSETCNASSLNGAAFQFHAQANVSGKSMSLSGASAVQTIGLTQLSLSLLKADRDTITATNGLFTSGNTSFVSFSADAVEDMSGNSVVEILPSGALQVAVYVPDTSPPQLIDVALDMNATVLTLIFDETVRVASLDTTTVALYRSASHAANDSLGMVLTGGVVSESDSTIVTIGLSARDANAIKARVDLGTSVDTTYVRLFSGAVTDTHGNALQDSGTGELVSVFVSDEVPPVLASCAIDLNTGLLTLGFDEVLYVDATNLSGLFFTTSIQQGDGTVVRLDGEITSDVAINQTELNVSLAEDTMCHLKRDTTLSTNAAAAYVYVHENTFTDVAGQTIMAMTAQNAVQCTDEAFTPDTTSPTLTSFDLNLNDRTLVLRFDDVVNASGIDVRKITLHNSGTPAP